jgi:uncharacterized membrane protein YeaQ/YmgE (transglycosylase-associated protein family)
MHFVAAVAVGGALGALAHLLMPGKRPEGVLLTIMLAITGAVGASLLGGLMGWYGAGPTTAGIVAPVLGAAIFLLLLMGYRTMVVRRTA